MPVSFVKDRHNVFIKYGITAVIIIACLTVPAFKALTITDVSENILVHCAKVKHRDSFSIKYIHSVNKSPVEDFFLIAGDGSIILDKSIFYSFGAGVPSGPVDGGNFHVYNDRIEVTGINRRIDDFLLFIGVTAEHRFRMNGAELLLRQIIKPQRNVRIEVKRVSLSELFFR